MAFDEESASETESWSVSTHLQHLQYLMALLGFRPRLRSTIAEAGPEKERRFVDGDSSRSVAVSDSTQLMVSHNFRFFGGGAGVWLTLS